MTTSLSRRGLLLGAAAVAVSRVKAADENLQPTMKSASVEGISAAASAPPYAYIGCYTGGSNARGISVLHYDQMTNELTLVGIVAPVSSPSFIAFDTTRRFLYSGNESGPAAHLPSA